MKRSPSCGAEAARIVVPDHVLDDAGIGGELVTQQSLANQSVYRLRVPGNAIYVVYAEDADGIIRNVKLRVR